VKAVVEAADAPVVVAGISAAALWGMPVSGDWPTSVMLLQERRGGGRIEPGVRRTSVGHLTAITEMVDGVLATSLARTALDVARRAPFSEAVGSVDWAMWRQNPAAISQEALGREIELLGGARGFRHMARIATFATSLSDSFGESQARAVIHLLGFAAPELQVEFRDSQGAMFTDFFWRSIRVAAEFDGKQKYTRDKYTAGDPSEVVWREKKRTDRLLRQISSVERIVMSDVSTPQRLAAILAEAGVPRFNSGVGGVKASGRRHDSTQSDFLRPQRQG
jgi:hypothetical protein